MKGWRNLHNRGRRAKLRRWQQQRWGVAPVKQSYFARMNNATFVAWASKFLGADWLPYQVEIYSHIMEIGVEKSENAHLPYHPLHPPR